MKKRILVVDEDANLRKLMRKILTGEGYKVDACETGGKALATLERARPDLILLELTIPCEDGFEICRRFNEDARTANVPLYIFSCFANVSSKLQAFCCGARRYFTVPTEIDKLFDAVGAELGVTHNRLHAGG